MRKKDFRLAFVSFGLAAALVMTSGCEMLKSGGPTSPSPGNPPPNSGSNLPSPGVSYPPLPHRERLMAADGSETKMWVELVNVDPSQGSFILLRGSWSGVPDCGRGACFRRTLRFGLDGLPNPATLAFFEGFFSEDGENPRGQRLFAYGGIRAGVPMTEENGNSFMVFEDFAPKYILVRGSHPGQVNGIGDDFPEGRGSTKFIVDYKPRP